MGKYSKYRIVESYKFYVQYKNNLFGWMYLYNLDKATGGLAISALVYILLFILIIVGVFLGDKTFFYIIFSILFCNSVLFVISRFWKKHVFDSEVNAKKFIVNRIESQERKNLHRHNTHRHPSSRRTPRSQPAAPAVLW